MRRRETGAYYVAYTGRGIKFLNVNPETKELRLTSCPHDVTLFTSTSTAERYAHKLRCDLGDLRGRKVGIVPTRTHAPNVISGA